MNKGNAAQYIPLVQALADGELQTKRYGEDRWVDTTDVDFSWPAEHYRRRPKPREWTQVRSQHGTLIGQLDGNHVAMLRQQHPPGCEVILVREVLDTSK